MSPFPLRLGDTIVGWIKKVLPMFGITFVISYLFARPGVAAEAIRAFFGTFESIIRFFSRLAGQSVIGLFARLLEPGIQRHLPVEEDERMINKVCKHWVVSPPWIGVMFLSIPTFVLMITARGFFWIPMLVGLYLLRFRLRKTHVAHMDRFIVTNMRVLRIHGVFNTHLATMPMTRILDIFLEQPVLGKILNYGHPTFESAAQMQGLQEVRYVARPVERDLTVQRVIQCSNLRKKMAMEDEDETDRV